MATGCCTLRNFLVLSFLASFYLIFQVLQFHNESIGGLYRHEIFEPNEKSLSRHKAPGWWRDAKLGIFVHWGLYSVPGFAPTRYMFSERAAVDNATWFKYHPYAEWYMNTQRIHGSPTWEFHRKHFGKLSYIDAFVPRFNKGIQDWDPTQWARLFRKAGAKYVVLTSKHHDGYTLWPSRVPNPYRDESQTELSRDIVGELGVAIRHAGLKYGLYYSGGLDFSFPDSLNGTCKACKFRPKKPQNPEEYSNYVLGHLYEIMENYRPCILWNDINFPDFHKKERLYEVFAHFYSKICPGHGIINDRWKLDGFNGDFKTPEYRTLEQVSWSEPWESNRGIGYSFGYNRNEGEKETMSSREMITLLIDIVSKGGNLLLDVGPMHDGSLSHIQESRLNDLADWMEINSEAIHGSRPFLPDGAMPSGSFRYTKTKDSMGLYVFALDWSHKDFHDRTISIPLKIKGYFIVEQFVTKHHIKEIHQTQEGMKTILRGVHYPDGHQKLPLVFRITTPRSLKKVVTVTGFK